MKAKLSNHAAALGRHGAKKRWKDTTADERAKVMEIVRKGKARGDADRDVHDLRLSFGSQVRRIVSKIARTRERDRHRCAERAPGTAEAEHGSRQGLRQTTRGAC